MGAFREEIGREVRRQLMNPEFDSRRSKNGGRVFWVKAASATGFGQFVKEHPAYDDGVAAVHTTMSSAASAVVADRGDEVRVTEGHTEELEKVLSLSVSGVRWIGEGWGTKKPVMTVSGAIHGIALTGAGIEFDNFRFASPPIDGALSMVRIKAAGCRVANIDGLASERHLNFVDCIRVMVNANDLTLQNINLTSGDGAAPDSFLRFEGSISRFVAAGLYFTGSVGTAGIIDDAGANIKASRMEDLRVIVNGTSKPAIILDIDIALNGSIEDAFFAGTSTTLKDNAQIEDGWRLKNVWVLEETDSTAQAGISPARDTN